MKPVCVKCQRFYRPKRNGIYFIEGKLKHNGVKAGLAEPESWEPYKLWHADLWECPDCEAQIIVGAGYSPIAEHYQPGFREVVKNSEPLIQVNDC